MHKLKMAIVDLLPPSISSSVNFHYLALFICHLFSNGRFRIAHIVHDPIIFDHDLFVKRNSICLDPIPLYLTGNDKPCTFAWNGKDSADNMLTIFFIDPKYLTLEMDHMMNQPFAYYRIVVFPSIFPIKEMNLTSVFHTQQPKYDSRPKNVSVFIENRSNEQTKDRVLLKHEPIFILNQQTKIDRMNLFRKTFEEYERMESIAIEQILYYTTIIYNKLQIVDVIMPEDAILNYYHLDLKQSYINVRYVLAYNPSQPTHNAAMILYPKSY